MIERGIEWLYVFPRNGREQSVAFGKGLISLFPLCQASLQVGDL
jgi:hypothetical protein